ncbi:MAG: trehalase family glycosidase, partial [Lautropia sp.]|nr:trehalase family glycosidase [Lautropia sp.]
GHFDFELKKYADKHGLDVREFERRYDAGEITEPELDAYFVHDRSMRESGLDTTTRFDNCCADLACVDLNSILYRVETDLAALIEQYAEGNFSPASTAAHAARGAGHGTTSKPATSAPVGNSASAFIANTDAIHASTARTAEEFQQRAARRQALMTQYLWNDAEGSWHDYNVRTGKPQPFPNASDLLPLWAGCCTADQAARTVANVLPKLLRKGGIASTAPIANKHAGPDRQWDYPYGWAPHQIMIWEGLKNYGFGQQAGEAAFAWLNMLVRAAVDYNGLITEKFNVEAASHKVDAEYGNVGARFSYIPTGGFGWTNTSFLLGLKYLDDNQKAQLNAQEVQRHSAGA